MQTHLCSSLTITLGQLLNPGSLPGKRGPHRASVRMTQSAPHKAGSGGPSCRTAQPGPSVMLCSRKQMLCGPPLSFCHNGCFCPHALSKASS